MRLPPRVYCFACNSRDKRLPWLSDGIALARCENCGAEWIEGPVHGEQAYSYSHIDQRGERYLTGRARRFGAYLQGVGGRSGRLLDVGCGEGAFLRVATQLGWDATGVELTEEACAAARAQTGFSVVTGDLTKDDLFGGRSFDVVTLWGVLEHVPNPEELLRSCTRLLAKDGKLLIECPNPQGLFRVVGLGLARMSRSRIKRPLLETMGAGHVVWYSQRSIRQAAYRLGLGVVELRGSRNSTRNLVSRWAGLPQPQRSIAQGATAVLNMVAAPLGHPNQITAALSCQIDTQ